MNYILMYEDDSLKIILECYKTRQTKAELLKTINHYRNYGFYGTFKQERA